MLYQKWHPCTRCKNTIRDWGSPALYTVDTVCTGKTAYSIQTALHCSNICQYILGKVWTLFEWADG